MGLDRGLTIVVSWEGQLPIKRVDKYPVRWRPLNRKCETGEHLRGIATLSFSTIEQYRDASIRCRSIVGTVKDNLIASIQVRP